MCALCRYLDARRREKKREKCLSTIFIRSGSTITMSRVVYSADVPISEMTCAETHLCAPGRRLYQRKIENPQPAKPAALARFLLAGIAALRFSSFSVRGPVACLLLRNGTEGTTQSIVTWRRKILRLFHTRRVWPSIRMCRLSVRRINVIIPSSPYLKAYRLIIFWHRI